jgi:hypothetical protein
VTEPLPHLSLESLADLLAAEGSDADVAHVAACAGCAGRLDELAAAELEVAAVLGSLPLPPMPEGLAERLQAAFDAEPPLTAAPAGQGPVALGNGAASAGTAVGSGSTTVTPFPHARRRRAWVPAAAAAAVVVLGGGLLLGGLRLPGGADQAATSDVSGAASAPDELAGLTRSETGTDYAADGTLAAALPALLSGSAGALTAPLSPEGAAGSAAAEDTADQPAAETAPEPAAAPAEQALPEARLETTSRAAQPAPELDRLRTPEALASCLAALLPPEDDGVRPLAVDYAAYQGQPALVVLLPAGGAPDKVDVFVVGAGCRLGDDRTLFFTRLDRP